MKTTLVAVSVLITVLMIGAATKASTTINYSPVTYSLSEGVTWSWKTSSGNFSEIWDLTQSDMSISFMVDLTGINGTLNANHAYTQFGIRDTSTGANWHGGGVPGGQGVWFTSDHKWADNAFAPHPTTQGIHDKIILQRTGGNDESDYNLYKNNGVDTQFTPTNAYNNYGVWFDRDGVDQWQAVSEGAVDGGTYNTLGMYDIVLTISATSDTTGIAYMTINGIQQGIDGFAPSTSTYPAGMTFSGDMKNMQVFHNIGGWTGPDQVTFSDIEVTGTLIPEPATLALLGLGAVGLLRKRK